MNCFGKKAKINNESIKEKRQPPQLINLKENCYMNSLLQALSCCNTIVKDFEKLINSKYKNNLIESFYGVLEGISKNKMAQQQVDKFLSLTGWQKTGHQDCFELLSFILNELYIDIGETVKKSGTLTYFQLPLKMLLSENVNCKCKESQPSIQVYYALPLPLLKSGSNYLMTMYNKYFEKAQLMDPCFTCNSTQQMKTDYCKSYQSNINVICIHIQANEFDGSKLTKKKYNLKYPLTLQTEIGTFELMSMIVHFGEINVGHYVAYCKYDGKWFCANDEKIDSIKEKTLCKKHCKQPYLLFYQRKF